MEVEDAKTRTGMCKNDIMPAQGGGHADLYNEWTRGYTTKNAHTVERRISARCRPKIRQPIKPKLGSINCWHVIRLRPMQTWEWVRVST
jgi:hypothetical protein